MTFDTHYPNRKDHRKPRRDARPRSCRNHGDCPWCQGNRQHKHNRRKPVEEADRG